MSLKPILILFNVCLLLICKAFALTDDGVVVHNDPTSLTRVDHKVLIYEDATNSIDADAIVDKDFEAYGEGIPNLGITSSTIWVKMHLMNNTDDSLLYLAVRQPSIDEICLFEVQDGKLVKLTCLGEMVPFNHRIIDNPSHTFPISLKKGEQQAYYLSLRSKDQIQLPILFGGSSAVFREYTKGNLLFGIYVGVILVMMLYNFFVALTVRDIVYYYYIIYIFFVGLTQAFFQGYAFKYLWPDNIWLESNGSVIIPFLSGISTILFIKPFLQIKHFLPRHMWGLYALVLCYSVCLVVGLLSYYKLSIVWLQIVASLGSVYVIGLAVAIRRKGYRPALFFLIAFSVFLLSVILFTLRNFNVIPYNGFTSYLLEIGSVIQIVLLSLALADKINIYKKEKEESKVRELEAIEENAKLVREQNIVLEHRVVERTHALQESNQSLQQALAHLKEAQAQLVEAEKMASLGQLTAGVAHEINNPINFVTSNVAPLKRDVKMVWDMAEEVERIALATDISLEEKKLRIEAYKEELDVDYLKTEIEFLLKGMHEGASRTAEIVKSLRIFSRVDEESLKFADINEGLASTLVILNSIIKEGVSVKKEFGELPPVECYPGKLNQVFLNIITNGIYAINKKFNGESGGVLEITTTADAEKAYISIADNGVGMSEEVMGRMFEPFFTTKDVGEGTGLGMSIVYNTIKKHNGDIKVNSTVGEGVSFLISIPLRQHK